MRSREARNAGVVGTDAAGPPAESPGFYIRAMTQRVDLGGYGLLTNIVAWSGLGLEEMVQIVPYSHNFWELL